MTGRPPYSECRIDAQVLMAVIVNKQIPARPPEPDVTDTIWEQWKRCWSINPSKRPTMERVVTYVLYPEPPGACS
jgi:hypothetical protein